MRYALGQGHTSSGWPPSMRACLGENPKLSTPCRLPVMITQSSTLPSYWTSRLETAKLETQQTQQKLLQTQAQLANAQKTLAINSQIYQNLAILDKQGAYPRLHTLKQDK